MGRVTMLLDNDFARDGRVRKEARSLLAAGYSLTIVAVHSPSSAPREEFEGAEVVRVDLPWWADLRGPARFLTFLRWYSRMAPLGREAARRPADVIHAHDLTTLRPAIAAARRTGAALVFDDHELYVETLNTTWPADARGVKRLLFRAVEARLRRAGNRLERRTAKRLSARIAVSDGLADEVVRRLGGLRPTVVANCPPLAPAPEPDGRLRRGLGVPAAVRIALFVGTFPVGGIGLEDLVAAVAHLPDDVVVALLGWGSGRAALERRARRLGVADRVRFLDAVAPEELPGWYADAGVSVVPNTPVNLSNVHGLPNKLFESMMAGVPVVAANSPDIRAVLETYPAGLVYRMGDPEDFAARIREALEADPVRRAAFRAAARRGVEESWSWERQEEKLLGLYERVLGRGPAR